MIICCIRGLTPALSKGEGDKNVADAFQVLSFGEDLGEASLLPHHTQV
jgi:hypothetical protein